MNKAQAINLIRRLALEVQSFGPAPRLQVYDTDGLEVLVTEGRGDHGPCLDYGPCLRLDDQDGTIARALRVTHALLLRDLLNNLDELLVLARAGAEGLNDTTANVGGPEDEYASHIQQSTFKSDKYAWCPPGFVPLKITDKQAQSLLWDYAEKHQSIDARFSADLRWALNNAGYELRKPIPLILSCPSCGTRHIDEGVFATKVHHTHACQTCGLVWRPAQEPTVGVQFLPGYKNDGKP